MEQQRFIAYKNKWFVLHHKSLYHENPNLIGFRDHDQWSKIKKGDLIVYYQAGAIKLRGIYEVIRTGIMIDPKFGKVFLPEELKYQHELKLLRQLSASFHQREAKLLSFHKNLHNPKRWGSKEVFPINNNDFKYILLL